MNKVDKAEHGVQKSTPLLFDQCFLYIIYLLTILLILRELCIWIFLGLPTTFSLLGSLKIFHHQSSHMDQF